MAGRVLARYHSLNITADKTEPKAQISLAWKSKRIKENYLN
jgi:hypothetical protein